MEKKPTILEQALLQVETLEEAVKQNAKGILASTMKEEIKDLLEQEEEDDDIDNLGDIGPDGEDEDVPVDGDDDTSITDDLPMDDEPSTEDSDFENTLDDELGDDDDDDDDDEVLDMTDASPEEVTKVFRAMKPEDGVIVKRDGDMLEVETEDDQFIIKLDEQYNGSYEDSDEISDENIYEIELDEEDEEECDECDEGDVTEDENDPFEKSEGENLNKTRKDKGLTTSNPAGKGGKPSAGDGDPFAKGEGGNLTKKRTDKGLSTSNPAGKSGEPSSADGDPFTNSEGDAVQSGNKIRKTVAKGEQTEALRNKTNPWGNRGPNERAGLKDASGKASSKKWRAGSGASLNEQVKVLKEQNDQYKKALVLFKEKLNEVAVFNANLAYATRLFTEHTTTKKEKLAILGRFDAVSTIKEAKTLYGTILKEFDSGKPITEAIADKISEPTKGKSSSDMLSESKVYENEQFSRMKHLMGYKF